MWKKVDDAVQKGLPKSAIEALSPIVDAAIADKAYSEAIKRKEKGSGLVFPSKERDLTPLFLPDPFVSSS